jgi:hypothetical protein
MAQPMNWITVILMVAIGAIAINILISPFVDGN